MPSLREELDTLAKYGALPSQVPPAVTENLNPALPLRPYQEQALLRLIYYIDRHEQRVRPTQLLFHMATGSGKTLIMAAAMLYLYQQGYRDFIFFVNSTTIIEKTRDNFLNSESTKYLFAPSIQIEGQRVDIQPVESFQASSPHSMNILFTTIQGLHMMLNEPRENALTYDDFEGRPIVLVSDEAHHINALTKSQSKRNAGESENVNTWEGTVNRIFASHLDNLLLEFTATVELSHPAVAAKYRDKILFDYSLKQFREDGYSKEVRTLQADLPRMDRALQAILVSQYRKKVAERHGIHLKPVVLMKANYVNPPTKRDPNKVVSGEFRAAFHERIKTLVPSDLAALRAETNSPIVQRAFGFFRERGINSENLIRELQMEFSEERALSVDSRSDSEAHQVLVNSLESPENEIRVVFAVEMLNEGWDVLNLFDIVRLYDTRDAKGGKPGRTTVSEAQLIGRGARYYPFQLEETQPRFQRKYDQDLDRDVRVLEELYYHSAHNPRYIQELHSALVDIGMLPERPVRQLSLNLKEDFVKSEFWKRGKLFVNKRVRNDNAGVFRLQEALLGPGFTHKLRTGFAEDTVLLDEPAIVPQMADTHTQTFVLRDFGIHLVRTALARNKFYRFDNLRRYFPDLTSVNKFITSDDYLGQFQVDVIGTPAQLDGLSPAAKLEIADDVLAQWADVLRRGTPVYRGTTTFVPQAISQCVRSKTIKKAFDPEHDVGTGMRETKNPALYADLRQEDWYVYDENYGTSEEKALVKFIQSRMSALQQRYDEVYLLRNEKLFQLYNFQDGQPFEPDFVLFLAEKPNGKILHCQLFIEPKGQHLMLTDKWKESFLGEIENSHRITVEFPDQDFRLIGLPFYNEQLSKRAFDEAFRQATM